jgi:hypothetical protein
MSETTPAPSQLVKELKVSAHLMTLQTGVFCIYHTVGSAPPDPVTGLPGARLTLPPGPSAQHVTIRSFRDDGWLGGLDTAALVRVSQGPAQILMTVYMLPESPHNAPKLQVMRLSEGVPPAAPAVAPKIEGETIKAGAGADGDANAPEVAAHIQVRGDVLAQLGQWIGEPGSQRWIEGFAVMPHGDVGPDQIEYQAVLGRGWLSPWAEGGQFCGSRGMALPILGLRVRLRGTALATHNIALSATFTDGTAIGPVAAGEPCEAASLAPLEAFQVVIRKIEAPPEVPAKAAVAEEVEVKKRKRVTKETPAPGKLFRSRPR